VIWSIGFALLYRNRPEEHKSVIRENWLRFAGWRRMAASGN